MYFQRLDSILNDIAEALKIKPTAIKSNLDSDKDKVSEKISNTSELNDFLNDSKVTDVIDDTESGDITHDISHEYSINVENDNVPPERVIIIDGLDLSNIQDLTFIEREEAYVIFHQ